MDLKYQLDQWKLNYVNEINDHYYYENNGKENLVVVLGDSWTWGQSLDPLLRLEQVYGKHLNTALNADWLNIGCPGWSNGWLFFVCNHVIKLLETSAYKKIYLVFTLTETAREISSFHSFPYDYIETHKRLGASQEFYNTILEDIEQHWIQQLNNIVETTDDRYVIFVGNNFAWHDQLGQELKSGPVIVADINWIELLADYQQLPRPVRTNMVTGWIFDRMKQVHDLVQEKNSTAFQFWALPKIEKANLVNAWLDQSALNVSQSASKHPVAKAHELWANYILQCLSQKEKV
jgi:hypothetical protein